MVRFWVLEIDPPVMGPCGMETHAVCKAEDERAARRQLPARMRANAKLKADSFAPPKGCGWKR